MKKFLVKATLFFIVPIFIHAAIFYTLKFGFIDDISRSPIIILGDSQTEFIRDVEIYNRSIQGSPYFVHFKFSEDFMEQVKGKKIYIACNFHNFSKLYQNRLANDSLLVGWRTSIFNQLDEYHIFNHKYLEIRPDDLDYTFFDIKKLPKLFYKTYLRQDSKNSLKSIINDTLSISTAIQRHWNHSGYVLEDSTQNTYLKKLITLLNKNDCEVVLLKMPLTNYYIENVPKEIKNELSELSNNHNIRILDLNKELSISNEYKYFKDYGHLNKLGDSLVMDYFIKNEIKAQTHKNVDIKITK